MCIGVLFACASVCHMDVWCLWWVEEGIECLWDWNEYHEDAGNELRSSGKEARAVKLPAISLVPNNTFFPDTNKIVPFVWLKKINL